MNNLDYNVLQQKVEAELAKQKRIVQVLLFMMSIAFYIAFMAFGWGLFLNNGEQPPTANLPGVARAANPLGDAMLLLSIAGFIPILVQFVILFLGTRLGERQMRERVTGRLVTAQMRQLELPKEKAKRMMQLGDDGELEAITDPDEEVHRASNSTIR